MSKQVIIFLTFILTISACSGYTYNFRKNAQGIYELIGSQDMFAIDATGSMAGTPETSMFFYQAKSDTDAVYMRKKNNSYEYIPIRLDGIYLYFNEGKGSSYDVSFNNMILFAKKIL